MEHSIAGLLPGYLVKALCATLIYSLLQGLLLAAVAGIIIACTCKAGPARRYNLLITTLIIFSCSVAYTFVHYAQVEKAANAATINRQQLPYPFSGAIETETSVSQPIPAYTSDSNTLSFLTNHSNTIVCIWILMLLARTLQLTTGLYSLYHLRKRSIFAVPEHWEHSLSMLAQRLGIKQMVRMAESAVVKVPMVIGHFKPIILVPVGLLTALPPEEVEAILAHELAHIYRRDYVTNLLVNILEILFFFNPAVLWMASLIRKEREYCCDDMVVEQSSTRVNYIRALVSCQEYVLSAPSYTIAFGANKGQLKGRVKRMISKNNPSLNRLEKSLVAICLIMGILLTVTFSNAGKISQLVTTTSHKVISAVKLPPEQQQLQESVSTMAIKAKPASIVSIPALSPRPVSDTTITDATGFTIYEPGKFGNHTSVVISNGGLQTHLIKLNGVLYQLNLAGEQMVSLQVNGHTVPFNQLDTYAALIDSLQADNGPQVHLGNVKVNPNNLHIQPLSHPQPQVYRADADQQYKPSQNNYQQHKTGYTTQLPTSDPSADHSPVIMKLPAAIASKDLCQQIIAAIMMDGLANEVASYKLTEDGLVLNGTPLPDNVFQQFKKNNIESFRKGSIIYYNFDINTHATSATIVES